MSNYQEKGSLNLKVFVPSLMFIFIITLLGLLFSEQLRIILNIIKDKIFFHFSWLYAFGVAIFLMILIFLLFSPISKIKLSVDTEEPEFSFFSWIAMLFAAGMGVGLMYFGVAEPIMHRASPISIENINKHAILYSLFHWGIHPWAIYGITALALAYFTYCKKLPLSLRSVFYPILGQRIYGNIGHCIDILSLLVTLFGIITTLGFSSIQLNAGLVYLGFLSNNSLFYQITIVVLTVGIAVLSVFWGRGDGIKKLSRMNVFMAMGLIIFILIVGNTSKLFAAIVENFGLYFSNLFALSFKTFTYESQHQSWFTRWTILYWAWWISWSPFVGLFIARISRGRSIREFIVAVLLVPTFLSIVWFTVLGNSAIWVDMNYDNALSLMKDNSAILFFKFLDYFPLARISGFVGIITIGLFFITSVNSGILVLNNFIGLNASTKYAKWQSMLWGVIIIAISISLLCTDGLGAIQAMTLAVTLVFLVLMLLMSICFLKELFA